MIMDERKFRILQAIIDDYILTAVPVGSRTISKKYDMGLSSATIRNEMSDLEELGYLDQPHVSAGRIPSAKAYRLYVDQLLKTGRIPSDSDAAVKGHFLGRMHQMEDVIDHAAQVLSSLTSYTAVVLPPTGKMPKIRTIQLVPVSDTSALVVIVTDMGIVRDQVVQVASDLDSDALYAISKTLTERLQGLTLHEAVAQMPQLMQGMHENERLLQGLGKALGQQDEMTHPHVAVGGTSNMLAYPEYSDMEKARSFLSLMETRDRLADIISQKGEMAFTVRIGPETGVPEMADCSIVTATYSTGSGRQGTIGVIGPTRMRYISTYETAKRSGRDPHQQRCVYCHYRQRRHQLLWREGHGGPLQDRRPGPSAQAGIHGQGSQSILQRGRDRLHRAAHHRGKRRQHRHSLPLHYGRGQICGQPQHRRHRQGGERLRGFRHRVTRPEGEKT